MRMRSPSIGRAAVLLSVAVFVTQHATAAPTRGEVKDRQGNIIGVLDGDGRRDAAGRPAPPALEPPVITLPDAGPALGESMAVPRTVTPVGGNDAWPMLQGNARHTGFLPIDLNPTQFAFRWATLSA